MSASIEPRSVVTRFAPSPTGFLHIGGARTALFNWLFARHHGGKFLLRIEDTDKARSTQAAIDAILDGMRWLGLDWDGDAYFQSRFAERHAAVAHEMLANGHAYRCYMTQEELAAQRAAAQAERRPFKVNSVWRDCAPDAPSPDAPYVVRLKAEHEGETVIEDAVQGRVTVQNAELDDMILLRSDGTPTYMLAVVVDDHDMGVTHVIRGDDHLNNAFRQLGIIRAMGWPEPVYAHVPLIHGQDGAKMSKRHGAIGVDNYRDELGILPEALSNYLLRLGWGHGDDEIIAREDAVKWFDLAHVGRSPSRFDIKKLENLNGHYIREADDARLADIAAPDIAKLVGRPLTEADRDLLTRAMPELKPRAKSLGEIAEGATFLFKTRPLDLDERAAALLEGEAADLLALVHAALSALPEWTGEATEQAVRGVSESAGVKLGQVAQPLRAALTGRATSPGIFDVLVLLGRDESLARIAERANL
ncbi:glutamate--tRNA ligase [Allosphingosinicella indica]|uniref:Glutamate--tRNA ligase n=1 Tax=Allosphingosinicella indica TaxID=941907 RepID=A0A1X7GY78_9SPHN|nr:glutamate--tRNA ligase [Allosphingosinicella indica]SMF75804.1 glutamyl-tRNA synthetase [Allosphingosinicella indica]